jgi:protein gp37
MSGPYWDAQWNVVQGCTPASEGCAHCWARSMHERFHAEPFRDVYTLPDRLAKPLHWKKPRVVFVCNTSDLFHPAVPFEFIAAVFGVMAACPQHTFLTLTKRADRMREFFDWWAGRKPGMILTGETGALVLDCQIPRDNVWLGVTVENQPRANERVPILLQTPATHRWVSAEPLLGGVDLEGAFTRLGFDGVDQVIVGGESGPRPCHVEWIRSLRDQCRAAGVPCYVKQLGSWVVGEHKLNPRHRSGANPSEWPEDLRVRELAWRES